jgi:hypothetical protein
MSNSIVAWVIAHKEWCFTVLCSAAAGIFAVIKWRFSFMKSTAANREADNNLSIKGDLNNVALIAEGASVNSPFMVGSNNVQNVVIAQNPSHVKFSIDMRKASSPTGNEIRQREEGTLQGIPMYLQHNVREQFYASFRNVEVAWPIRLYEIHKLGELRGRPLDPEEDDLVVEARYGDESWGARIRFTVKTSDYPILKTICGAHRAFVEGRISRIEGMDIVLEVSGMQVD